MRPGGLRTAACGLLLAACTAGTAAAPVPPARPAPPAASPHRPPARRVSVHVAVPAADFVVRRTSTPLGPGTVGTLVTERLPDGRPYAVHVPRGRAARPGRHPLIVLLPGRLTPPAEQAAYTGLDAAADAAGVLVVYGSSSQADRTWNAGLCCGTAVTTRSPDIAYVAGVVAASLDALPGTAARADARRVVVVGFSNGGMLALLAACSLPTDVEGAASVEGPLVAPCRNPAQLLHLAGTADRSVPLVGGTSEIPGVVFPDSRTEAARVPGHDDTLLVDRGAHLWPTGGADGLDATATILAWLHLLH